MLKIIVTLVIATSWTVHGAARLSKLNVDTDAISVSGISSGAAMANQFHVAFSSKIMGVGLVAGVPYLCAPAATCMATPSLLSAFTFQTATASARMFLNIDSTFNMKNHKIWIFAGTKDTVVRPAAGRLIKDYYHLYVNSDSQIRLVNDIAAEHGQPTNNYGGSCGSLQMDNYLNNCGYSAAYHMLDFIYGGLQEPAASYKAPGDLLTVDQSEFTSSLAGMDSTAFMYVPTACKGGAKKCKLHIAFHGCQMGRERIGDQYVKHAGYNEVGELNDIIILYPQVKKSSLNPNGCWDWFGYTGIYYAFHSGPQMRAVHKMMDRITG